MLWKVALGSLVHLEGARWIRYMRSCAILLKSGQKVDFVPLRVTELEGKEVWVPIWATVHETSRKSCTRLPSTILRNAH